MILEGAPREMSGMRNSVQMHTSHLRERGGHQTAEALRAEERYPHESWSKTNRLVTRRERLFKQLETEFKGDKDAFFAFITIDKDKEAEKKPKADDEKLWPYRKVVEAIPHRDKDLAKEKEKAEYQSADGNFSDDPWVARWGQQGI
ncbi:hypothetical protein B0H14DRAFT_2585461 [Mycena olivaceomarginata]|nr:hypothetical protein B0H14DRAFT_2585461 [Mycena olivaceomarginata]